MLWGSFTSKDLGHNPGISTAAMCAMCRTFQIGQLFGRLRRSVASVSPLLRQARGVRGVASEARGPTTFAKSLGSNLRFVLTSSV